MVDKYLSVGNACNLKCKFCYNDITRTNKIFFEPLKNILINIKKIREKHSYVVVIGGEPFFHPEIEKILIYTNKLEFENIWIVTNGIKISDINFAILLYKYGVNSLEFSIHANSEELEKKISGRSGDNLLKREKGIKNILLLNKKFDNKISLKSNTVINLLNYKNIINVIKYIISLGIKDISLSFIYNLKGFSEDNKNILVKYNDVVNILNSQGENFINIDLEICWLPYCIHKKITGINYKIREEKENKKNKYTDNKKEYKIKTEKCKNCSIYGKKCNGVFKDYLDLFGDSEFKTL